MFVRSTQHKIGHFRDVLPSQSLRMVFKSKLNLTKQKKTCIIKLNYSITQGVVTWKQIRRILTVLYPAWKTSRHMHQIDQTITME